MCCIHQFLFHGPDLIFYNFPQLNQSSSMTYKALTQLVNVFSKLGKPLLESTPCFPVVHAM